MLKLLFMTSHITLLPHPTQTPDKWNWRRETDTVMNASLVWMLVNIQYIQYVVICSTVHMVSLEEYVHYLFQVPEINVSECFLGVFVENWSLCSGIALCTRSVVSPPGLLGWATGILALFGVQKYHIVSSLLVNISDPFENTVLMKCFSYYQSGSESTLGLPNK